MNKNTHSRNLIPMYILVMWAAASPVPPYDAQYNNVQRLSNRQTDKFHLRTKIRHIHSILNSALGGGVSSASLPDFLNPFPRKISCPNKQDVGGVQKWQPFARCNKKSWVSTPARVVSACAHLSTCRTLLLNCSYYYIFITYI